jgi:hypothetical protein
MKPSSMLFGAALALSACQGDDAATPTAPSDAVDAACVDDRAFFREQVWPEVIQPTCMACHTAEGAARDSDLVFASPARPDHLDLDQASLRNIAGLERDGTSLLLLKPIGEEGHGGGPAITKDSDAWRLLEEFVRRAEAPVTCPNTSASDIDDSGLVMLSPAELLRKASLLLVGRLPSPEALASVRGGDEAALRAELDALLEDPALPEQAMELFNDLFLTDRYLLGRDGLGLISSEIFPNKYWFEDAYDDGNYDEFYDLASDAVAREPLELIAHVLREHRPWTEILTADYTMVNTYSALSYGLSPAYETGSPDDPVPQQFYPATIDGWPHAGVLSTPAFVNRYPTTETNRNRHRAWNVFKTFLGTDILAFAERPIDPTISSVHNPTLNDPQCTVCHATMDPVAGLYQDFDDEGQYRPREDGWYPDMVPPAWGEDMLPAAERGRAVAFLGARVAQDPRFPLATVQNVLHLVAGAEILTASSVGDDPARVLALADQELFVERTAALFVDGGYELRDVIREVVLSRWFRAKADAGATEAARLTAGTARLLTPEQLSRKIRAATGMAWTDGSGDVLLDDFLLLYGGIDSFGITERLRDANGVISSIGLRMATDMACRSVPVDFALPVAQRRLFPHVETSYVPETDEGFDVAEARTAIRENIRWLHWRLLGEELADDSPELEATWELWRDTWRDQRDGVADGSLSGSLPWQCDATEDPITGADLPSEARITRDDNGAIHAWMAVMAYLLTDARFLYE